MPYSDQVDAAPVRRHLRALVDGGMSVSQIEHLSGVNRTAIRVILGEFPNRKPSFQVRALTASRILRTRLDPASIVDGLVPGVGTMRRLHALQALGWTQRYLADRLGCPARQLQYGRSASGLVRADTAIRVEELYLELADRTPPSSRAATRRRTVARERGWLPPIWWDDDTIDDPAARPKLHVDAEHALDEILVLRILGGDRALGRLRSPERTEAVRRMAVRGLSDRQVAEHLGISAAAVFKIRERNDIPTGVVAGETALPTAPRAGYGPRVVPERDRVAS